MVSRSHGQEYRNNYLKIVRRQRAMTKSNTLNTRNQDKPNKNQNVFKFPRANDTENKQNTQTPHKAHKAATLKQSCGKYSKHPNQ